MANIWLVRAGEGGRLFEEFAKGYIGIGYNEMGDMSDVTDLEDIRTRYLESYPDVKPRAVGNQVAMFYKFRSVFAIGDKVITYDTKKRELLIGTIQSDYLYKPGVVGDYPNIRKVKWEAKVSRDDLTISSRNSLGCITTLFSVDPVVWQEIESVLAGNKPIASTEPSTSEETDLEEIRKELAEKAHEFIKDKILALDSDEMEELVAAILRGMGYQSRVSPKGPDRGIDVMASPDGLGLEEPRIKAEVKHRQAAMGSKQIRSFLGGLREGDRALYISTGGFSKDAKYEADRSNIPLTLLDLDDLASLVVTHYEKFDLEGRALIPLVRV
ncbi:MAG: restriction endonuclease, partial [Desulfobulbaceae bacterium]|nr:restriction endonuclease [Desulfobulbaceae bacterium]